MGGYILVTVAVWLERTIPRIIELSTTAVDIPSKTYIAMVYCVYLQGIIYSLFYVLDKQVLTEQSIFEEEAEDARLVSLRLSDFELNNSMQSVDATPPL